MNSEKIAFITAVNNESQYNECQYYIDHLDVPTGFAIEKVVVRNAPSMCNAYNQAMKKTDAKYKVYLHQDVLIRNKNIISDLLEIFKDDEIGLVGMAGGTAMPTNGICFATFDTGIVEERGPGLSYWMAAKTNRGGRDVVAVDGLLMATQVDIPWREDLFRGFHYYDISQSFEMLKAGYRVYVPHQDEPWAIHNCALPNLIQYERMAEVLKSEYPEFLTKEYMGKPSENYEELQNISQQLVEMIRPMISAGEKKELTSIVQQYKMINFRHTTLEIISFLLEIWEKEDVAYGSSKFINGKNLDLLLDEYQRCVYGITRLELDVPKEDNSWFISNLKSGKISAEALKVFVIKIAIDRKKVYKKICDILSEAEILDELHRFQTIGSIIEKSTVTYGYMLAEENK